MRTVKSIPIIQLGTNLIVSIQVSLSDRLALKLQDDIAQEIIKTGASGLVVDVSAVEIIDTFIARTLSDISKNARTMGTMTVIVGLQPAVAMTLIEMGMELEGVYTALDLDHGLEKIRKYKEIGNEEEN